MKKVIVKKHARARKAAHAKPLHAHKTPPKITSLQKARVARKLIKEKLIALKADFKIKLAKTYEKAYAKARNELQQINKKKEKAQQQFLSALETKRTPKKGRKNKSKRHLLNKPIVTHVGKPPKKRGRPAKKRV